MHIQTEYERTLEFMKNNPSCVNVIDEERKATIDNVQTPYNEKALETGITDINEAARNLYECALYTDATDKLTINDFYDSIGTLVAISNEYYVKKPQDAPTNNVDETGVWRQDEYMRLHPEEFNNSVDHPQHYTNGEIECKDAIKSALTTEEYRGWIKGNTIKYVWRERYKGGTEDLQKARNFLSWLDSEGGQNE